MLEELYEEGIFFYLACGICALNIIMKMIASLYCTYVRRQSVYMEKSGSAFAVRMKKKFDNEYDKNGEIRNVELFVRSYISGMRIAGFRVGFWRGYGLLSVFVSVLLCVMCVILEYFIGRDEACMVFYALLAPALVGICIFADAFFGMNRIIGQIITNAQNYYENYVIPKKARGSYDYDRQKINSISDEIDNGLAKLTENIEMYEAETLRENINKNKENNPGINLSNGEQKIFEEIINEYLT